MSKKIKKVIPAIPVHESFLYLSVCCNERANKPPVERSAADRAESKYSECGLGKWHCSKCGNHCKVKRQHKKEDNKDVVSQEI